MQPLGPANVAEYLRSKGYAESSANIRVSILSGGVSNAVLRVEQPDTPAFVIKQSRERLRTDAPWFSRLDRIWRETAVMEVLRPLLPMGAIPRILFEDRENYLFAMEAVDPRHVVWKDELLADRIRPEVATTLAAFLATIHGATRADSNIERQFDDREIFVQLRVDPFYRHIAAVHPDLRSCIDALIDEMWSKRLCLVLGDFSPKNVLIIDQSHLGTENRSQMAAEADLGVTLIDFETGHYGDPAFDVGFFLSHLLLKGVRAGSNGGVFIDLAQTFWSNYRSRIEQAADKSAFNICDLERRAVAHLAGCALARIDGTSPVGYLAEGWQPEAVRRFCRRIFRERTESVLDALTLLKSETHKAQQS
jgi:5-methylthioribose kinase